MKTIIEERKEYVDKLLDFLSKYFEVDKELILTSRAEEYVEVRYLLIQYLCSKYSDREVAKITDLTKSGVNTIKNKLDKKESLRELYNSLIKRLESI